MAMRWKADTPLGEAARRALARAGVEVALKLSGARRREDAEGVHKMRVAVRRLSAVLDALARALPKASRKSLSERLRRLRDALGGLRDLDVEQELLEELAGEAGREERPILDALAGELAARRPPAEARLDEELDRFEGELAPELSEAIAGARGGKPAGRAFARRLERRIAQFEERLAAAGSLSPEALHALRKAAKKVRYLVELGGAPIDAAPDRERGDGDREERMVDALKALQRDLGRVHDLDVLLSRMRRAEPPWSQHAEGAAALSERVSSERARAAGDGLEERLKAIREVLMA